MAAVCALVAGCAGSEPGGPTESATSPAHEMSSVVVDGGEPDSDPRFGSAWLHSVSESLDLVLWEHPAFTATWSASLRELQHRQGDLPVILCDFSWTPLAEALLEEAEALPSHGLSVDDLPPGLVAATRAMRGHLYELPALAGTPEIDAARVLAAVHGDQLLIHLLVELSHLLGASHPIVPRREYGMDVALVSAVPVWADEPALVRTLGPPNHGYGRMRVALDRYEIIADTGGFIALDERRLKRTRFRRSSRALADLRQRLAQEDPLLAPEGDTWDDALTDALRRARTTYQLRRGKARRYLIDRSLLAELALPVEMRLETVRRNLQRWRTSERRHFDYAVHVNLPDYHGEVWDGDERLRRFKVVIGNTRRANGTMVNATPNISSAIRTVIFNPYWNVPKRIAIEELVPQAHRALTKIADALEEAGEVIDRETVHSREATAEWFETNGYDVLNQSASGRMWLRQRPGRQNALGKVKFLFDNRDSIFMHDTPSKAKFHFPRRAYSHGCVRVQKPVELAKLLLRRDGSWSRHREHVGMRTQKQLVIKMARPIHLVVDYITNHVDDHGRLHWLHDIYGRDTSVEVASR
jgi:hypothetical protein